MPGRRNYKHRKKSKIADILHYLIHAGYLHRKDDCVTHVGVVYNDFIV